MCPLPPSRTPLPSPSPTHPSRLSQSTGLSFLCHTAHFRLLSLLHTGMYVSMLVSQLVPHSPSLTVSTVLFSRSVSPWVQRLWYIIQWYFPGGSDGKVFACNAGDLDSVPGSGRSPGEGNGNPLQYACLENSMDGGAQWAIVHGVAKSRT